MGKEKIYCGLLAAIGWALINYGVKPESPYFGIALVCTAIVGWLLCRAAEFMKALSLKE